MKLGIVLIVHFIFLLSHKNCGCNGNRNSQNVALVGDSSVAGNTCALVSIACRTFIELNRIVLSTVLPRPYADGIWVVIIKDSILSDIIALIEYSQDYVLYNCNVRILLHRENIYFFFFNYIEFSAVFCTSLIFQT